MSDRRSPIIFVISSPSGGGKTSIIENLLKRVRGLERSVSCTTRKPRAGEKDGVDYIFLTREEFGKKAERGEFLEWTETFGNLYGTLKKTVGGIIKHGTDALLCIDVKGARNVRKKYGSGTARVPRGHREGTASLRAVSSGLERSRAVTSIFVMPPSAKDLTRRLKKRNTEDRKAFEARLRESEKEIREARHYDYVVVNDDLKKATGEVERIIEKKRKDRDKR